MAKVLQHWLFASHTLSILLPQNTHSSFSALAETCQRDDFRIRGTAMLLG